MIDEFAAGLRKQILGGSEGFPPISSPETWEAWQLPAGVLDSLFASAAAFYAAHPWTTFSGDNPVELLIPSGARWFAAVLGFGGEQFGLVLYELLEDIEALFEAPESMSDFAASRGVIISLSFDARADLPKAMRRTWPVRSRTRACGR